MSGIAGLLRLDGGAVRREALGAMLGAMHRRGPDGTRGWVRGSIGLGHCAHWTTEEAERDDLPLLTRDESLAITADVRLDNRDDLSQRLGLTASRCRQLGDAALVLASYRAWGRDCLRHLLGDFAFAIWDARPRQLLLARDHFGNRSLYWYRSKSLFAFASSALAIEAQSAEPLELSEVRVADFLGPEILECYDATSTFFTDVHRLPPAHSLSVGGEPGPPRRYWRLDPEREVCPSSEKECEERFRDAFTQAVTSRLRSQRTVGSMLSGGLDSSSIVCVAREHRQARGEPALQTFSAVSRDGERCPEGPFVDAVEAGGGLLPHRIAPDEVARYAWALDRALEEIEDPYDFGSICIVLLMCAAASEAGTDVLLDGVDGDLVTSQGRTVRYAAAEGDWREAWRHAGGWSTNAGRSRALVFWEEALRPRLLFGVLPAQPARALLRWRSRFWRRRRLAGFLARSPLSPDLSRRVDLEGRLASLSAPRELASSRASLWPRHDHRRDLEWAAIPTALERYERRAVSLGLEARHPFLDRRLAELCLALPWQEKVRGGEPKALLRHSLRGTLPEVVRRRTLAPSLHWRYRLALFGLRRSWIRDHSMGDLSTTGEYVDVRKLRRIDRAAASGDADAADGLWKVALLAAWRRRGRHDTPAVRFDDQSERGKIAL